MLEGKKSKFIGSSTEKCDTINMPFLIITKNLIIRPLVKQDQAVVMEAIRESLQSLQMWLPWTDTFPSVNEYASICQKFYTEAQEQLAYHFVVYQNEVFMGMCSLMDVDLKQGLAKLGYWCRTNSVNQNYFIEAINAKLRYSFEKIGLKEIYIQCMVGNFVSELAAKELNFRLQSVDLIDGKQFKLYKIESSAVLPELDNYSVVE